MQSIIYWLISYLIYYLFISMILYAHFEIVWKRLICFRISKLNSIIRTQTFYVFENPEICTKETKRSVWLHFRSVYISFVISNWQNIRIVRIQYKHNPKTPAKNHSKQNHFGINKRSRNHVPSKTSGAIQAALPLLDVISVW